MSAPMTWDVVESILPNGNFKVLDVGAGEQLNINHIWEFSGYDVHRCDLTDFPGVPKFTRCDLNRTFPYGDNEFDLCIAVEMIEHMENPRHFLRELKRISKGPIILTTPNLVTDASKAKFTSSGLFSFFEPKPGDCYGHITPIFIWQIDQICKELNLRKAVETYNMDSKKEVIIWKLEQGV